jgi:hypothetical protein
LLLSFEHFFDGFIIPHLITFIAKVLPWLFLCQVRFKSGCSFINFSISADLFTLIALHNCSSADFWLTSFRCGTGFGFNAGFVFNTTGAGLVLFDSGTTGGCGTTDLALFNCDIGLFGCFSSCFNATFHSVVS